LIAIRGRAAPRCAPPKKFELVQVRFVEVWFAPEKLPGSRCGDGKACRVKILKETLWWSFPGAAKKKQNKAASGKKNGTVEMTFTGSLIESLMATVERAERRASSDEPMFAEGFAENFAHNIDAQPWVVSMEQNADYDSKFLGVA
jgi:hypothetical protein